MILTVMRISWLNLRRDRVALALTFVLPLVFFSIFALVFGALDDPANRVVRAALVVEDVHPAGIALGRLLTEQPGLRIVPEGSRAVSRDEAERLVRSGAASAALVVPRGFGEALAREPASAPALEVLADRSDPLAPALSAGYLQTALLRLGAGALGVASAGLPKVSITDVVGASAGPPSVAFFAAGIGVMFLLFAVSGRSAILLEERESGVLEAMLSTRLGLTRLLLGRWLFLGLLGIVQITAMFVWGSLAFGLDLWTVPHLVGFTVVTLPTAAVAAAFGLVLSAACRSRAQLNGVAVVVILILSALGGSMFPRFLMPDGLRALGRLTFNAWALDAYHKVFWYEASPSSLWPELLVLGGFCTAFLLAARRLAERWREV